MSYNEGIGIYNQPPCYSIMCECGVTVTGTSENGLHSLLKRHKDKGKFHLEYKEKE